MHIGRMVELDQSSPSEAQGRGTAEGGGGVTRRYVSRSLLSDDLRISPRLVEGRNRWDLGLPRPRRRSDCDDRAFDVIQDVLSPEPEHADTLPFQPRISARVVRHAFGMAVPLTVDFNG